MTVILVVRFMVDFIVGRIEEEGEGTWFLLTPPPVPPPALVRVITTLLVRLSRQYNVITPDYDSAPPPFHKTTPTATTAIAVVRVTKIVTPII